MNLYSWQEEFINIAKTNKNIILTAPTGAGKTKVAYIWAEVKKAIAERSHKVFYTVPIKALANEKYEELKNLFGETSVGIVTGDVTVNKNAPVILCTQEVFVKAFKDVKGKVIIDEFHYIFADQNRSRAYIDSTRCRSDMMILSATLGDVQMLASYMKRVSGKEFSVYETDFRPTKLEITDKIFDLDTMPQKAVLIYAFTIRTANAIAHAIAERKPFQIARLLKIKRIANKFGVKNQNLQFLAQGIAVYHGKLQYNEKLFIEELVRKGHIDILVSTSALSVGVNLPIEWVLFSGFRIPGDNGFRIISKTEFVQMAGRAGRPGYYDTGYVGCLKHGLSYYESKDGMAEVYKNIVEAPLEKPVITLSPNIESIIKGKRSVEDELHYIRNYSLPEPSYEYMKKIEFDLCAIREKIDKISPKVKDVLMDIYNPELSVETNIQLAEKFSAHPVISTNELYSIVASGYDRYQGLLVTYRAAKRLRRIKYLFVKDFEHLVETIKKIDPFVLKAQTENSNNEEVIL